MSAPAGAKAYQKEVKARNQVVSESINQAIASPISETSKSKTEPK